MNLSHVSNACEIWLGQVHRTNLQGVPSEGAWLTCDWTELNSWKLSVCVRVLSLRSGVIHEFCDRALTLSSCPVFMWACGFERARAVRSFVCVACWSVVFGFRVGVRTLALRVLSHCVSVRSAVHVCFVVLHAACVFQWLRPFMLSCLVWTRGLWIFSLAMCSCPVMHMAGDFCFAGHVLVFLFCVSTWLCLSFLCAMCSHVYLSWPLPILFPDYWLICPACVYLVPLLNWSLYNLLVFEVLCQFIVECFLFLALPCLALYCPALPSLASSPVFSCMGQFLFIYLF